MENKNTSKNNFYKKNLKYLLDKEFYLVGVMTELDDYGISHDNYHFMYKGLADADAFISLPVKILYFMDIETNEVIKNKLVAIIARKD